MCGIAGIFTKNGITDKHHSVLNSALLKMKHRGPDFHSVAGNGSVLLGHTRLSIIDTSASAHQPFYSPDKNYAIVFNGEIFNFPQLKSELIKSGIQFQTRSDTEVLLQLLIHEGKNALTKLNGFFAFAFYNFNTDELLIARDRFGEKPLKYFYQNKTFCFGSDLNALRLFMENPTVNSDALQLYFQYNYIPAPFTIYSNCYKLMPGEFLIVNENGIKKEKYYSLKIDIIQESEEYFIRELQEKLYDAVKLRLISDVSLGCFLSGGIDSTIISGIANEIQPGLNTFSIGFPDQKHFDETEFAIIASKHLNTKHEVFNVNGKKLIDNFRDVIAKMDEPFADSSALAVYELSRQTKTKITVSLSGDGADELFGGYHKHKAHLKASESGISNFILKNTSGIWKKWKGSRHSATGNRIRKLNKYSAGLNLNPTDRYIHWASAMHPEDRKKFFNGMILHPDTIKTMDFYFKNILPENGLNGILATDISLVLANDMLVKTDLMSMANSLEMRPPFLDYRIVELALRIPEKYKIKKGSKKHILKESFKKYLPAELINRPKKGFEVPLHSWFNHELKKEIESNWLNEKTYSNQNFINVNYLPELRNKIFSAAPGDSASHVWAIIVLNEWMKENRMEL